MNVAVVVFAVVLSVLTTVPETELLDASFRVNVLVVMVELSINSEKVADMVETTLLALSDGLEEETVGAVPSNLKV